EINGEERCDENTKRANLLRNRRMIGAQGDAEHRHAEGEEKAKQHLRLDIVFAKKLFQLRRIKVCQHLFSCNERWDVRLRRKLHHLGVGRAVAAYIHLDELVAAFLQELLGVNAPGTHGAAVQFETSLHAQW